VLSVSVNVTVAENASAGVAVEGTMAVIGKAPPDRDPIVITTLEPDVVADAFALKPPKLAVTDEFLAEQSAFFP